MTPEQENIHRIESNMSPVVSLDAARLERAIRSARVAEAMNFPIEVPNNEPLHSVEAVGVCRKLMRNIAIFAGAMAMPSVIVPLIIGVVGIIVPLSLAAIFVGGVMFTREDNNEHQHNDYIGP